MNTGESMLGVIAALLDYRQGTKKNFKERIDTARRMEWECNEVINAMDER